MPRSGFLEHIGEPELARFLVFQRRFLRLQFPVCQSQSRWSANPVTLVVEAVELPGNTLKIKIFFKAKIASDRLTKPIPVRLYN